VGITVRRRTTSGDGNFHLNVYGGVATILGLL
jgi:hypothetical protein